LLWVIVYYLTVYLQEQDWLKNFEPYEVLGVTRSSTVK
jgi:translocation protein SEC63